MNKRTSALLIDDDAKLASLVAEYLGQNEVDVTVAGDGERGLAALKKGSFDVVLLEVMLTAKGDDVDKIVGLELGADDYMAKPFNPRELLARVRAVLRRAQPVAAG